MEDNRLIKERKEKVLNILKMKDLFSAFVVLSAVFLLLSFFKLASFPMFFLAALSAKHWFYLSIAFALSSVLLYYKKDKFIFYPLLVWVIWLSTKIRTANLPGLKDITTGGWTLGPDLDPFLFLRWAKYIVAHGSLFSIDPMRYIPLGYNVKEELLFHPYMMAWFHKLALLFGSVSVEQSAVLYPVFMFALTVIAFFLLTNEIFKESLGEKKAGIIALIASLFLSTSSILLPRTIAGIPEKESAAFLFLFIAFYFFILAWKSESKPKSYFLALLAGMATAGMALIWGGFIFIFLTIAGAMFFAFLLKKINMRNLLCYIIWLLSSSLIMNIFSTRYSFMTLLASTTTGSAFAVLFLVLVHFAIFKTSLRRFVEHSKLSKLPKPVVSLLITILLGLIATITILGPSFILHTFESAKSNLVTPVTDRFGVTVAENRQPYFSEWANNFGPMVKGIPILFWLFFVGSIYLFGYMTKKIFSRKERILLTLSYIVFLTFIIFSRYSPDSTFNGTNFASLSLYAIGIIVLLGACGYYYFKYNKEGKSEELKSLDFSLILVFLFFFLGITSARGAVRLIMMLAPTTSILVSFFVVQAFSDLRRIKDDAMKVLSFVVIILVIFAVLFSAISSFSSSSAIGASFMPTIYTQQWQKAMSWVRENTPTNAVFGHWWDYGYWLQSIGQRATVLDGGNSIVYWNHMMGRYALTAPDDTKGIEYLYAHNTTHFLIDSTDIGKYGAFSSIGSDENYDRRSWIGAFIKDESQTQETKNSVVQVYRGGISLDGDIVYEQNGTKIFLPAGKTGIAFVVTEKINNGTELKQPKAVFVYQNQQYVIPLRYAFEDKLIDFGSGIESGIFLMPRIIQTGNQYRVDQDGALLFLTNRTVKSQIARLYLYNEDNPYFKLVHSEEDFVVSDLKKQGVTTNDFVFFGEFRGPIRIWEIKYPEGMQVKEEYLRKTYPSEALINL